MPAGLLHGGRKHARRPRRAVAAATALLLGTAGALAGAGPASAAPAPGASASPTSIVRNAASTVTLTLDGENSTQSTPTDLVLVLDESGSISSTAWQQLRSFSDDVVEAVADDGLFANGGRVGVVGFATSAQTIIPMWTDEGQVRSAIMNNPQSGGLTCIACGLEQAQLLLAPHDPARNRLVVVITDGNATERQSATAPAATNLQSVAKVFAVGVGSGVSQSTLETIASGAGNENTFAVANFDGLAALLETLVAAVVVPGATNPSITVALAPGWDLVAGSVLANLTGSVISAEHSDGFTWSRDALGDENLVLTYDVRHEGAPCGALPVNDSVAYSDAEGSSVSFPAVAVTVECLAPVADAGPDQIVAEGSSVPLDGTGSHDPDGVLVSHAWSGADPGVGLLSDASSAIATYAALDDGVDQVLLDVTDDNGLAAQDSAVVTVQNVAPSLALTSCPIDPTAVGGDVSFAGDFTDPGALDTHSMSVDWGDGSTTPVPSVTSPVSATHQYASAGVFDIAVLVTDDDGGTSSATCGFVVVFDPEGGFVTGGGHIDSPAGAYAADPQAAGRASFGFVSKYKRGASTPTGSTEFQFAAGDLNFHSSSYQWLVVAGSKAQFKGTGTVNGVEGYGFMLTATDASPDTFRIKIWRTADDSVVYDNQMGSSDAAEPTTALTRGSIVVHRG